MKNTITSKNKKILMLSVPFVSLMLPSQQFASILGYLRANDIEVHTEFPSYEYRYMIGEKAYRYLQKDDKGNELFGMLLCEEWSKIEKEGYPYELYRKTIDFTESFISNIEKYSFDYVVIHVQYSQLIPALYFAKEIKKKINAEIILTGFHCGDILGENLKEIFPFLSKTIGENFEENLLAYIRKTEIYYHETLDFLPLPDYEDAYNKIVKLKEKGMDINENSIGYLVEFSRGCRWNKCSFCTLNCHTHSFRTKSKNKIAEDYRRIRKKYKTNVIIPEHFVVSENWKEEIIGIADFTKNTSKNLVLNFKVKDLQDEESFRILGEIGASVLIGTESFSSDYLVRLNKGQTVIENIQSLKFAERWNVPCFHNIMYNLPFENDTHLAENKFVFEYIYHLQPPFDIEEFRLTFNSLIFNNRKKYGIKKIVKRKQIYKCFSDDIAERYIPFFYDFEKRDDYDSKEDEWKEAVDIWRKRYYYFQRLSEPQREKMLVKSYYDDIFQIVDYRMGHMEVYKLNGVEKMVYDFVDEIRSIQEIYEEFSECEKIVIDEIIEKFFKLKIAFVDENLVLGLAL